MSFKRSINKVRGNIMGRLTKNVGTSFTSNERLTDVSEIKSVLISRPNHRLGNQLLLTPLVQEVIQTFPDCKIDLFVKGGVAHSVFENYNRIDRIIQLPRKPFKALFQYGLTWLKLKKKRYDLVINVDKNSSSGRLSTKYSRARFKLFGDVNEEIIQMHEDHKHISKYPIYNLRHYLNVLGLNQNRNDIPLLDIKLNKYEVKRGKQILDDLVKNDKKTICIYTNATGNKCYSEQWWTELYIRLLEEFPEYNVIEMLPVENISRINFEAPNFYSKDIREMGGVLRAVCVFIAGDNGVMHLASASLTPTIGFFKTTKTEIYEPYGNGSFSIDTNNTNIEDCLLAIKSLLN